MTHPRVNHYMIWFWLFGVISLFANYINSGASHHFATEDLWMFGIGGLGWLTTFKQFAWGAKPFDVLVGTTFFSVGLLGILHNFQIDLINNNPHLPPGSVAYGSVAGISLCLLPSLVHMVFGFFTLNYAMKSPAAVSSLLVSSSEKH